MKLSIKFKKLNENAKLPTYAKPGDAGLDLTAVSVNSENLYNQSGRYIEYGTGLAVEIPPGYVGLIYPRSSITNKSLMLKNAVGVIDSSYRGEIKFRFQPTDVESFYNVGERIGQLIIMPYPEVTPEFVEELSNTERGIGGYGHTGV